MTLILLAVWAAYAIPGVTPARVPEAAAEPTFAASPTAATGEDVVVASLDGVPVMLPVAEDVTTAIAYHPVDNAGTVGFSPDGDRISGGSLGQRLADIFAGGGGVKYYLMDGDGQDASSSTAGLDVGAVPGSPVVSPVDGKVVGVKTYQILGRYQDTELDVQVADDASLLLVITHLAKVKVAMGDTLTAGETPLGTVRGFPSTLDQSLSRYTSDSGDHLQLVALRVTPDLSGQ